MKQHRQDCEPLDDGAEFPRTSMAGNSSSGGRGNAANRAAAAAFRGQSRSKPAHHGIEPIDPQREKQNTSKACRRIRGSRIAPSFDPSGSAGKPAVDEVRRAGENQQLAGQSRAPRGSTRSEWNGRSRQTENLRNIGMWRNEF